MEDFERSLEWEHDANYVMDGCHHVAWQNECRSPDRTPRRITAKRTLLTNAWLRVAEFAKMVDDCKTRIWDVDVVCTTEYNICHAKFAAADTLIKWASDNPTRLSFECDITISNTSVANLTFSAFVPVWRLAGQASERCATLETLESNRVKEKRDRFGSFRRHL